MILETVRVGGMQVNCYVLACAEGAKAVIIDPGDQAHRIKAVLEKHRLTPGIVINTHGHFDHIAKDDEFGVEVYVHKDDRPMLEDPARNLSASFSIPCKVSSCIKTLEDGDLVKFDCIELEVMHLPGHSPGGIALLMKSPETGIVFTGDTLFCRGVGRCDLPGGNEDSLGISIRDKLFTLPENTKVYPGHGPGTTIGEEKRANPFII